MRRMILVVAVLAGCREEQAALPDPVALTAQAVGHFCQMDLLEHDGPKAQVHLAGSLGHPLFFSQVRDAVAYARLPEQSAKILGIYVNDMGAAGATWAAPGATNWINARDAVFVIGSARVGGMGASELVPFANLDAAQAFAAVHGGQVMELDAVPDDAVLGDQTPAQAADGAEYVARLKGLNGGN